MTGASAEKGFDVSLLEPSSHLRDLLANPSTPPAEIAAYREAVEAAEYTFPRRGDAAPARGDRRDA